jgi:hypothetical protein
MRLRCILFSSKDSLSYFFELQKNEPKQLKRLSRAQNRTPGRGVQFWAAARRSA